MGGSRSRDVPRPAGSSSIWAAELLRRSPRTDACSLHPNTTKTEPQRRCRRRRTLSLSNSCHHLLTNEEDYVYKLPRLTQEKRARWRFLAKRKIGVELKSAATRVAGRWALYGTGIVCGAEVQAPQAQISNSKTGRRRCRTSLHGHSSTGVSDTSRTLLFHSFQRRTSSSTRRVHERLTGNANPLSAHRTPAAQIPETRGFTLKSQHPGPKYPERKIRDNGDIAKTIVGLDGAL